MSEWGERCETVCAPGGARDLDVRAFDTEEWALPLKFDFELSRLVNRRFAKLYLLLFVGALTWHAEVIFHFTNVFINMWRESLASGKVSIVYILFSVGFAMVFVWPKLFCLKLAWTAVRNRPLKTGILCGIAPILTLMPLTIELAVLVFTFPQWQTAVSEVFGVVLLFALDLTIWVLLCSSDTTRQNHLKRARTAEEALAR